MLCRGYCRSLGPSGSGKSSLVRAGLIPELARRSLPGKEKLQVAMMVPGAQPLEALAGVLAKAATQDPLPVEKAEEFERVLRKRNKKGQYDGLRRIANMMSDIREIPMVVIIDQLEEVFSLCKEAEQRNIFITALLEAANDPTGNVSVVVTLRSDFWGETQRYEELNQIIGSDRSVNVPAMTVDELQRAIKQPAELAGNPFDEATAALLVKDAEGREGALPLLQFALARIWEGLRANKSPAETYWEIGGVGGALAKKAQNIYEQLSAEEQTIARRAFVGLVQLGEGVRDTRRRIELQSLVTNRDTKKKVKQVMSRFSSPGARLVSLSSEGEKEIAEITHEALFDNWQLLNDWLNSSREDIRFQRRVETDAIYWDKQGRPRGLLWRPPDLDLLKSFEKRMRTELSQLSATFFEISVRSEARENKLKFLGLVGLVIGLLTTTSLSGFSGYKVYQSEQRRLELYENRTRDLATSAPIDSLINGLAAIQLSKSPMMRFANRDKDSLTDSTILEEANRAMQASQVVGHTTAVIDVVVSANSQTIASLGDDGAVRIWDQFGNLIGEYLGRSRKEATAELGEIMSIAISADGENIFYGNEDGLIQRIDRQGIPQPTSLNTRLWGTQGLISISEDGQKIVGTSIFFSGFGPSLRVMDSNGRTIGDTFSGRSGLFRSIAMSADGETIVSGGLNGYIVLWDSQGHPIRGILSSDGDNSFVGHSGDVNSVAVSANGRTIVSGGQDGTVRLWDRQGTSSIAPFQGHSDGVTSVGISANGKTIVSGSEDGTVRVWDQQGRPLGEIFKGHSSEVKSVSISADGKTIVSGSEDGTVQIWRWQTPLTGGIFGVHDSTVSSVAISADGKTIVSGSWDRSVRLWDRLGNSIGKPLVHPTNVTSVAISDNGEDIVSSSSSRGDRYTKVALSDRQGDLVREMFRADKLSLYADSLVISADGQTIAGFLRINNDDDVKAQVRDSKDVLIGEILKSNSDTIQSLAISADGQTIVSGDRDNTVRLWNRKGDPIGEPFIGHSDEVLDVAMSADGQTIVSGSGDSTVRLWNQEGNPIGKPFSGHTDAVASVAVSADGQTIVSGSRDSTVRLWNREGNPIGKPFIGHTDVVTSVAVSADGETIVSGSVDSTVRLWTGSISEGWGQLCL